MKKILLLFLCTVLITSYIYAGTTGKLAGKVTDQTTGESIPLANIILEGTSLGGATDLEGNYMINNIPPGEYNVVFSSIGFQKRKVTKVQISVDFTTRLDATMASLTLTTQEVVIEAKAPLVRTDLTSSHTTIEAAQIQKLPVESVTQLLTLQAGVVQDADGGIHIRGGRSNEVAYTVNGMSVSNPFSNTASLSIATNAIQELSVISGTFNAEYGSAMSGIVNTITKEGGSAYTGQVSFYTGDYVSNRTDKFYNIGNVDALNNTVSEFTLGGPIPFVSNLFNFFLSGRYNKNKGWLYGIREHNTSDQAIISATNPNDIRLITTGDGKTVSMNPSESFNGTAKVTFKPISNMKINYDLLYSKAKSKDYSHMFKYDPDALGTSRSTNIINSIELRHAVDSKTFYTVKGSYNVRNGSYYLYPLLDANGNEVDFQPGDDLSKLHADSRYQPTEKLTVPATYTFYYGGTDNSQSYSKFSTFIGKFDIVSQVQKSHEVKFGLEYRKHELASESFTVKRDTVTYTTPTILGISSASHDYYKKKPEEFSTYIQDKMEYSTLVLNVGLRYDYFNAHSKYSTDIMNPSPNNPSLSSDIDKSKLLADAEAKQRLSPRLGISFPITDKGIIHFSYGHFYQMPSMSSLYTNSSFKYSVSSGQLTIGNANLNPQKTVSYELGVQQQLSDELAVVVTGFVKDVRDLFAVQYIRISGDETYARYVNQDYGNIKGITVTLTKRRTKEDMLGASLDYTYQTSEGNNTNSDAFFLDMSSGRQSEKIVTNLGWAQTHTLNASVIFGDLGNWNISLVGRYGSGMPYTPELTSSKIDIKTNSGTMPSTLRVDLFADKIFNVHGVNLSVFVKVFNLFDILNDAAVYSSTGKADYTLYQNSATALATRALSQRVAGIKDPNDYFNDPTYYYSPREVRVGVGIEF